MPPGRLPQPKAPKRAKDTSDEEWKKQEAEFQARQEQFRRDDQVWQATLQAEFATVFSAASLRDFDGVIFLSTTGELPVPEIGRAHV